MLYYSMPNDRKRSKTIRREDLHWTFPKRGDWATHDAKWRGNWSHYIPRNIMLRYSKEGDCVLDQFAGGGTTLVEAKLLNRNIIGVDVNDVALERCREKTNPHPSQGGRLTSQFDWSAACFGANDFVPV